MDMASTWNWFVTLLAQKSERNLKCNHLTFLWSQLLGRVYNVEGSATSSLNPQMDATEAEGDFGANVIK